MKSKGLIFVIITCLFLISVVYVFAKTNIAPEIGFVILLSIFAGIYFLLNWLRKKWSE